MSKIEYSRNFGNKLWQIAKFVLANLGDAPPLDAPDLSHRETLSIPDRWLLSRLAGLTASVQRLFETYQYGEAGRQIQDFVWTEFADWSVEVSKNALYGSDEALKQIARQNLLYVLDTCLRLLHPFMPFVTEEIWKHLPTDAQHARQPLIISHWPTSDPAWIDAEAEASMDLIRDLVVKVRNVRTEYNVEPGKRTQAIVVGSANAAMITRYADVFSRLCNVERISVADAAPENAAGLMSGDVAFYLPLADMVDFTAERERLTKELSDLNTQIDKSQKTLGNEGFVSRAKPEVVARERNQLAELTQTRAALEDRVKALPV